jgi:hypothetical protein
LSHIVQVRSEVRDRSAVEAACRRLGLEEPADGETELFSGAVSGLAVRLPNWRYPVVCDLPTGQVQFDNFGGRWGEPKELDRFLQGYAVEKAKIEARKKGMAVAEQQLADGSIKLTIQAGTGDAA